VPLYVVYNQFSLAVKMSKVMIVEKQKREYSEKMIRQGMKDK